VLGLGTVEHVWEVIESELKKKQEEAILKKKQDESEKSPEKEALKKKQEKEEARKKTPTIQKLPAKEGINLETKYRFGYTELHMAASLGNLNVVKDLVA
jgi:hypothetical protein